MNLAIIGLYCMCYRHELWKDYENSEYIGNRNLTKTRNGTKILEIKKNKFKQQLNLSSRADFFGSVG